MSCIALLRHGFHLELVLYVAVIVVFVETVRHLLVDLSSLTDCCQLAMLHPHLLLLEHLVLLLSIHFGLVIEYVLSLFAALIVFTVYTLAV